jgi:hypothetical protein
MERFFGVGERTEGRGEIEYPSTATRQEGMVMLPAIVEAHPPAKNAGRVGQPNLLDAVLDGMGQPPTN